MQLEVISKSPAKTWQRRPILFVHGAWHAAWCWEATFLPYFAEKGWEVHALSLRGHGKSEGREKLRWWSIADYVSDIDQVARSLREQPILVGHSLGGLVVQKYLETHTLPGAVLMNSVPPAGALKFNLRIIRKSPLKWLYMNLFMTTSPFIREPERVREWFFSADIPSNQLAAHHCRMQEESFRAAVDGLFLKLPKPKKIKTPILVLGAENDAIFSEAEIRQTAHAYGVEPIIFPGMAHNMMSERNWRKVADTIMVWIEDAH